MPVRNISIDITDVDTEAKAPLGQCYERYHPTFGEQTWIYVFNDEAATAFAAGNVIARDASTVGSGDGILAPVDAPSMRVMGVAQHAIPAGSYGWIQRKGSGAEVLAGTGGITANTPLTVNATNAGTALDGSATESCFAFAHEAAIATALATCTIDCRG